jgi:uncharacterized protein YfaS (alpha-2-macroglobulin family)
MQFFKNIRNLGFALGTLSLAAGGVFAQSDNTPIPERRIELSENTDFFGSDLRNVFDVTFEDCVAVCLADQACKALTYNQKSNACFPKSAVGAQTVFDRAISVEVFETTKTAMNLAQQNAGKLGFLPQDILDKAREVAVRNGAYYPTNRWTYDALRDEARSTEADGRHVRAMELVLASLNDDDRAEGWIEVARLANVAKPTDNTGRNFVRELGAASAVNGFLRAASGAAQVNALLELSQALEKTGNTRLMVPSLRLAADISPRKDVEDALDRAIRLYGFRITDHTVDHNTAEPRVCVEFSEELVKGTVEYSDFVRADINGLVAEADGQQLCVTGIQHGATHRISFRQGLPSNAGETLAKTIELNVYVQDRDPVARFAGQSYLLPQRQGASVPLITVNLDKVDVKIYRVGDRNLLRTLQEGLFSKPISRWDLGFVSNDLGQEVWSGTADVARELNREVTTALPIGDALTTFDAGVYALTARVPGSEEDDDTIATQWFIVSDIGIATMKGNDGLHVFAKSLRSAGPIAGAQVQLVSKSNVILGTATTDAQGYARFAAGLALGTGGAAPALVSVETAAGDYAFLDQGAAEYDLSDRGVEGREAPPPIDVFLATDRGAYRPGETVHTTILARDHTAAALDGVPLTLDLLRPDGVRFARVLATGVGAGGAVTSLDLPPNAARGTWKLRIYADRDAPALLEQRILVEDFVPEKIDFDLALGKGPFVVTDRPELRIDARYLFGAIGSDLAIEGEVKLAAARALAGYPGFQFGAADDVFQTRYQTISDAGQTGADGSAVLNLEMPDVEAVSKPLEMTAVLRLRDGSGRPVERRVSAPVLPGRPMIGMKPLFDGAVAEGGEAEFEVIAVGADGSRISMENVSWELNRLHTRYQWYQQYGSWSYEPITRRERISNGDLRLLSDDKLTIAMGVAWGEYELKLTHKDLPFAASSLRFNAGWYASGNGDDTPDLLDVAMDRATFGVGDVATLRIDARFDGMAQVSVLSDRLIETRAVAVTKGANSVSFDVTAAWGAGAYLAASVVRPMEGAANQDPSRAIGLAFAKVDPGAKLLRAIFVSADQASPRGSFDVALKIEGLHAGETGFVTIAAVDVGVLNLTGFQTPSPDDHYFGQRKLGMQLRDVYGRLIDGGGAAGRLRSGGDGAPQAGLQGPPPTEEVLAQFSGMLTVGDDGLVHHSFDLPDFNGTVRLMAVVWSGNGVGHSEQDVLVRDPVVLAAHTPRFMTPGDSSRVRLELTHAFGPVGDFEVTLGSTAGLDLTNAGTQVVSLAAGERKVLSLPISASFPGEPRFEVFVKTPDGKVLTKTVKIPVQWNNPEIARQTRVVLAPGNTFTLDQNTLVGFHAGTVHATLAVGPLARFDAPGLLSALDRYPYGCTEQVTSKAMPLLYFEQLSSALGLADRAQVRKRIDQAIDRVLSNQGSNGAFGLWYPDSGDLWLDSYVSDFLSRARAQGYAVPAQAFEKALNNLRNRVNYADDFESGGEDVAYALMVLAREGYAAIGDLRYYADTRSQAFATPLAQAQMGAALASYGDQARADRMFRLAGARVAQAEAVVGWRSDYGSSLRDSAAVLALAVDAGSEAVDRVALAEAISRAPTARRSTQENMWSLMAVNALVKDGGADGIRLNGAPMTAPLVRTLSEDDLHASAILENAGPRETTAVVSVFGVPSEPEPAGGNGYSIERQYFTPEGVPVTLDQVAQNARVVVVIKVTPLRDQEARLMVNDPLPAGLEIDNPNLIQGGDIRALDWLDLNADVRFSEFRTDRFLAAVDWSGRAPFQLAYMVRAVSPGSFHHPAAVVEDMYRPDFRARTGVGRVTVAGQ